MNTFAFFFLWELLKLTLYFVPKNKTDILVACYELRN